MAASTFEEVATIVKARFDAEFAAEGFVMVFDQLHASLGRDRVDVGIAPVEDVASSGNALVQETYVEVRFYDLWKREIDPRTVVNPIRVTGFAERFRDCLRGGSTPGSSRTWFFDVRRIVYPDDPTGNKTRFHATIRAYGQNSNLVETTA